MVTDAMSAKELAEFLAKKGTLVTDEKPVLDGQPKKRGGRPKKDADKE
jgi:hypothetical protein